MRNILIVCIILVGFIACEKSSGEGGTSVIEGQVWKIFISQNPLTGDWDTAYYQLDAGKDVFIIYSNNPQEVYDDKFETDYNGRYRFEYLRKGDYTVYTYADSTDGSGHKYDFPVFKNVKIDSDNSTFILEDFIIDENL